ncbi:MAG: SUMF1/EgtB/PvdO family nonheme iron enzyme [Abitibacteriaceae bacterium]|nr:SUMF1/EgtB/PvdO family nonheme iron enzyme [Abditibacteriaceae bacterium]MBV9864146.1 SUMF1/EgtB/PvdO family nonheme iron enzyme [Abditibacteriaceae bacterium]
MFRIFAPCYFLLKLLLVIAFPLVAQAQNKGVAKAPEGMVYIPGGPFAMGTNEQDPGGPNTSREFADANPRREVKVGAFYIDKLEVTNAQYKQFCDATHYPPPPHWKDGTYPAGESNVAVYNINWWEASAYAAWAGKRLPMEAEWEKAARGTDARRFPWGNDWDASKAVWGEKKPQAVGTKPQGASPYGVLDMAGNVFEWVNDWYDAYPGAKRHFPEFGTTYKVIRGGGFMGYEFIAFTYYRCVARPQTRSEWIGLRCVKSAG